MEIKWTEPASADLLHIEAYAGEHSGNSVRFVLDIIDHAYILASHPEFGRKGRKQGTRELVFGKYPYILVYRIKGQIIEILRVLHTSRKWP